MTIVSYMNISINAKIFTNCWKFHFGLYQLLPYAHFEVPWHFSSIHRNDSSYNLKVNNIFNCFSFFAALLYLCTETYLMILLMILALIQTSHVLILGSSYKNCPWQSSPEEISFVDKFLVKMLLYHWIWMRSRGGSNSFREVDLYLRMSNNIIFLIKTVNVNYTGCCMLLDICFIFAG